VSQDTDPALEPKRPAGRKPSKTDFRSSVSAGISTNAACQHRPLRRGLDAYGELRAYLERTVEENSFIIDSCGEKLDIRTQVVNVAVDLEVSVVTCIFPVFCM
jgi:hypothetical protein